MVSNSFDKQLRAELERLSPDKQQRLLEFARTLNGEPLRGVPGEKLLRFGGLIDPTDLAIMERVIEEECERIDPDEW